MIEKFLPDERCPSVYAIDYETLWNKRIRGLIFDLDNTLGPHRFTTPDEKLVQLVKKLQSRGFQIAFLSNHNGQGRERFQTEFKKVSVLFGAKKPLRVSFQKVLGLLQLAPQETAMIGDQLFTDIWGAKRCGLHTILVDPVDLRSDPISIRWRRWLERCLVR
jgi:hypothetical protein